MAAPATRATTLFSLDVVRPHVQNAIGTEAETADDARLALVADGVSARIESETRRVFVTRSLTEVRDGDDRRTLRLRTYPVESIDSLTVADDAGGTPVALVEGTDYDVDFRIGEIRLRTRVFTRGFQNVAVIYTAGFDAQDGADLPADIYQAGLDYVKFAYKRTQSDGLASSSVTTGGVSGTFIPAPPKDVLAVLDSWRAAGI